jgi:hypothetical protein
MAAIARDADARPSLWQRIFGSRIRWASTVAATAMVVSGVVGGVVWQHERTVAFNEDRAAGEAAKARLELALRITSVKLQKIGQRVKEINQTDKKARSL